MSTSPIQIGARVRVKLDAWKDVPNTGVLVAIVTTLGDSRYSYHVLIDGEKDPAGFSADELELIESDQRLQAEAERDCQHAIELGKTFGLIIEQAFGRRR